MNSYYKNIAVLPILMLLLGCTVGPDFQEQDPEAPADWSAPLAEGLDTTPGDLKQWWLVFDDPALNELIDLAIKSNNNLQISGLRIIEAQAQLGIAKGSLYPQTQVLGGAATRVSPAANTGSNENFTQYGLGATVSWEIDFWGRFRRGIEASDASYFASVSAYEQSRVLLIAAVADTYAVIRINEEQLRIARDNLKIQQRSYDIAAVRFRNGDSSELDMQQAETLLLSTESTVPALEVSLRQSRNALSTLLGQQPGGVEQLLLSSEGIGDLPLDVDIGVPADMLRRRPDVRQAEFLARAQSARVGVATADLYPSFSLGGAIGLASTGVDSSFGNLFDSDALTASAGPSFSWPFFNYGRIRNNVRVQDARLQQALVSYRETVLQAARETEDAIVGYVGNQQQAAILEKTVQSAVRSNELSTLRYKEGFSDYQRVLDAQQALFTQQQRYVTTQGNGFRSLVSLYKALGGGWQSEADEPIVDEANVNQMKERTNWGKLLDEPEE